jgi:hypothetical protein
MRPEWTTSATTTFTFDIVVRPRTTLSIVVAATPEPSLAPVAITTLATTSTQCADKTDEASSTDEESEHVPSPVRLLFAAFCSGAKHRPLM